MCECRVKFSFYSASLGRIVVYSFWWVFKCLNVAEIHSVGPHVYKLGILKENA